MDPKHSELPAFSDLPLQRNGLHYLSIPFIYLSNRHAGRLPHCKLENSPPLVRFQCSSDDRSRGAAILFQQNDNRIIDKSPNEYIYRVKCSNTPIAGHYQKLGTWINFTSIPEDIVDIQYCLDEFLQADESLLIRTFMNRRNITQAVLPKQY